ncbi:SDR family NAD(P)-dependent oxidoreductase [Salisediminibacterium beveridgei]|uniref:Oxidoreductase, short chain dehydrogenase/reductase family n=1 Tax=Salisediminibacterium beveridgei TaxID=632773 RepID=A0A1D7QUN3_9BACI|nr:SDR family oxidoreductase [Salisediminibacterium beveridgei]AOM82730.1 Oxidoreductase, short chain dehydrogenase/reductase family [Salisediminibacterium beveridgei]
MNQQHIVVTGGAQGIGKSIARGFINEGYLVTIIDKQPMPSWVDDLKGLHYIQENLAFRDSLKSIIDQLDVVQSNPVTCFIHNAGLAQFTSLNSLTMDEWDEVMNTNVRSAVFLSRYLSQVMPEGSSIILIASTRAMMSEPDSEAYAASKGALRSLTHALAASLQEKKITVNSISPGWIHTGETSELRKKDHDQHFSKRVGHTEDVTRACLFLSDPLNQFINGEDLVIDGGMTRKMIYGH